MAQDVIERVLPGHDDDRARLLAGLVIDDPTALELRRSRLGLGRGNKNDVVEGLARGPRGRGKDEACDNSGGDEYGAGWNGWTGNHDDLHSKSESKPSGNPLNSP